VIWFTSSSFRLRYGIRVVEPRAPLATETRGPEAGLNMNDRTETMAVAVRSASTNTWGPHLARGAYVGACAIAMFGWTVALSWAAFSLLWLVVSQFT
jgi:hypothetical protein